MTQSRVNASTQDIEKFIPEYLREFDAGFRVICKQTEPFPFLSFQKRKVYDTKTHAYYDVQWCYASLLFERDNTMTLVTALDLEGVWELCNGDFFEYERVKEQYQNYLNYLSTALLKKFGKPEKPKQKGRYRLQPHEIKFRKQIVKKANDMRKENPRKYWKEIADELDVPYNTLRDWQRNY